MAAAVLVALIQQQPQQEQQIQAVVVEAVGLTVQTAQVVQVDQAFLFFPYPQQTTQAQLQVHPQSPRLVQTQ
jgi:hypothetical protein